MSQWAEDAFEVVALRSPMPGFHLPGRVAFHVRLQDHAPADPYMGWTTHAPVPTLTLPELDDAEQAPLETGRPGPRVHALAARIAELVVEGVGHGRRQAYSLRWPTNERRCVPVRGRTGNIRAR
ncbi:hypothetical protein [Aureimonas sp. ME7]|uniref:hypothetical protein n=1 Tax=Aureimonas sp. ME7 TaxID=2744252 RepID=UPI0015F5560B|nr:hypothetical protein [Aureimonas sp. ME7]